MNEITHITFGLFAALALALVSTGAFAADPSTSLGAGKPNIVFIFADNLGYGEIGSYGGGILRGAPTPKIDSLAAVVAGPEQRMVTGFRA